MALRRKIFAPKICQWGHEKADILLPPSFPPSDTIPIWNGGVVRPCRSPSLSTLKSDVSSFGPISKERRLDKLPYLMSIIVVEVEWTGGREPSEPEHDGELARTSALFPLQRLRKGTSSSRQNSSEMRYLICL